MPPQADLHRGTPVQPRTGKRISRAAAKIRFFQVFLPGSNGPGQQNVERLHSALRHELTDPSEIANATVRAQLSQPYFCAYDFSPVVSLPGGQRAVWALLGSE